jgi:hypothetical protein
MSDNIEPDLSEKEKLERTSRFIDLQLEAVQHIITYIIQRGGLSDDEIAAAKKRSDSIVFDMGEKSQYLGELLISVCFCYDGALRTMLNMIQDKIQPTSTMKLDEIANEVFRSIKDSGGGITKN